MKEVNFMNNKELMQFINTCESLEVNKDYYLGCIEKYKNDINSSILNHNLKNFETLLNDYFDMNSKYDDHLLTSDIIKINQMQQCFGIGSDFGFNTDFIDEISDCPEVIELTIENHNKIAVAYRLNLRYPVV